jgi:hypothetical protein
LTAFQPLRVNPLKVSPSHPAMALPSLLSTPAHRGTIAKPSRE